MSTGAIGGIAHAGYENQSVGYKIYECLRIALTDILPTTVTCVLPNALSWAYRTLYTGSVQYEAVTAVTKTGYLFSHTMGRLNTATSAILLLHGDHSHPFSMLHLADIAEAQGRAVFSVYLPYQDEHPEGHRLLLKKSIERIGQMMTQNGGRLFQLLLAGHSRGALEAAHEAFVENNPKVSGVIAIAGRFKVIKPSLRPCRESLESSVQAVWQKLGCGNPGLRVPFYQMAAMHDWCIDPEASMIRQDHGHLFVDADHLGIINHPDALRKFKAWGRCNRAVFTRVNRRAIAVNQHQRSYLMLCSLRHVFVGQFLLNYSVFH